jgi:uncharacterized protein YciI
MPFHIYCIDDPEKPGLRNRMRREHLEYMIAHKDQILFGGPLKGSDGGSIGSAFALSYETRAEVDAFLAHEPYAVAALFSRVEIFPIAVMVPEAHPGFLDQELERQKAIEV